MGRPGVPGRSAGDVNGGIEEAPGSRRALVVTPVATRVGAGDRR